MPAFREGKKKNSSNKKKKKFSSIKTDVSFEYRPRKPLSNSHFLSVFAGRPFVFMPVFREGKKEKQQQQEEKKFSSIRQMFLSRIDTGDLCLTPTFLSVFAGRTSVFMPAFREGKKKNNNKKKKKFFSIRESEIYTMQFNTDVENRYG
ncbi:hypothetical protein CEXT_645261 [Caerostris extrusa]|uniref:Ribosomal protein S18 n=1 Tax=Caerostris extrusa TaxID=172846 RepID=A0AAV4WNA1_CAEEX|nr:hypothetical protein CEXT_645261 [Caerostris extrusa]